MSAILDLDPKDLATAADSLGRAFEEDPLFRWVFPDDATRPTRTRQLLQIPLEYGLVFGRVRQSNDAKAVVVWAPPERPVTIGGLVRCGMLGAPFNIGFGPFWRFMKANAVMDKFHSDHVPEPHWYLFGIGVAPELQGQGQGMGTALIREGLAQADEAGYPCYLETSTERNVPYYERFGFRVIGEAALGKNAPLGWAMRREGNAPA